MDGNGEVWSPSEFKSEIASKDTNMLSILNNGCEPYFPK